MSKVLSGLLCKVTCVAPIGIGYGSWYKTSPENEVFFVKLLHVWWITKCICVIFGELLVIEFTGQCVVLGINVIVQHMISWKKWRFNCFIIYCLLMIGQNFQMHIYQGQLMTNEMKANNPKAVKYTYFKINMSWNETFADHFKKIPIYTIMRWRFVRSHITWNISHTHTNKEICDKSVNNKMVNKKLTNWI